MQYGQAADNYHSVERWGEPVRPYGEWRFPVRPYSTPYGAWGGSVGWYERRRFFSGWPQGYAPAGIWSKGIILAKHLPDTGNDRLTEAMRPQGEGYPWHPNGGASLTPYPTFPGNGYPVPPYYDGAYPTYGESPRLNDRQFYFKPRQ
ncbi:MAG: hypothetical protein R3C05_19135 [Pirellulaceae bacterium]